MKKSVKAICIALPMIASPCIAGDFMVGSWITESIIDGDKKVEDSYGGIVLTFYENGTFEFEYRNLKSPYKGEWKNTDGNIKIVVLDEETSMSLMETSMLNVRYVDKGYVEFSNEMQHKVRLKRVR